MNLRSERLIGQRDTDGRPALFEQFLHFGCIERTELVNKPYSGVELRKTRDSLFDTRHAYKDHPSAAFVENGSHLFEAVHLQPVCFIDQNKCGGIGMAFFRASYSSKVWK
jgi:hypothetical protein